MPPVTVDGLTKVRMLEIEAASVTGGNVNGAGHLILVRHDGALIDAGSVIGPQGPPYVNGVDTVADQAIDGQKTFLKPVRTAAGTAALPSHSFTGDPNTGIYNSAPDEVAVSTNGVNRLTIKNGGVEVTQPVLEAAGTAALPSFSFTGDPNTGIYNSAADEVAISTGGVNRITVKNAGVEFTQPILEAAGTAALPSFSFTADPNTGIYNSAADEVAISTGGVKRLTVKNAGVDISAAGLNILGTTIGSTVLYLNAANGQTSHLVDFDVNGVRKFDIDNVGVIRGSQFNTFIPGGEFGQVRLLSPANYGRVELQGNSNGLILVNNAGSTKWLVGSRFDITGNFDDLCMYSYAGNLRVYIGGTEIMRVTPDNGGDVYLFRNPGAGTQSSLRLNFSFVGDRRLDCGPADSAGAGFRQIRCAN